MSIEELEAEVKALRADVASLRRELQFGLPQEVFYPRLIESGTGTLPPGLIPGVWCCATSNERALR